MDIAIFIPTHNRPHCLKRLLLWLRDSNLPLYIADSSKISNESLIKDLDLRSMRIKYFHKSDWLIYEKWSYVASQITEKYTVPCAEDDFPVWQNFHAFYDKAESSGAGCVVGREISAEKKNDFILFEESQEYRRWCIHNTSNKLLDFQKAHNPIVCTFYQFFKSEVLKKTLFHWASLQRFYPGNKINEIVFRSSTFILSKVTFENTILNVRTNEPTLRYSDTSPNAQKFKLNFWDEVKKLSDNKQIDDFLSAHSQLILDSPRWNLSKEQAFKVVKFFIWQPMLSRMRTRHEIIWKSRVKVLVSAKLSQPKISRDLNFLVWQLPLVADSANSYLQEPVEFINLESFILKRPIDKRMCMMIARILLE